ncbi:MAG: aspartyl protease family protein [Spirosomaceae bacterium]|nr:aspartyl protease family protein [Spirosomataceae bacterium]
MNIKTLILALFTLCWCQRSFADQQSKDKEVHGLHLAHGLKSARIPFETYGNLIVVPVLINKSDTLQFVLDTGVSTTILTDTAIARKLGLKSVRKMKIDGVGAGKSIVADITIGSTIQMGAMRSLYHNIVVMPNQALNLSEYIGTPIHGIFGYEIFSKFVVTLDFRKKVLILQRPEKYQYHPKNGDKFPIVVEKYRPHLEGVSIVANNQEKKIKVVLDTGAGHALMFNSSSESTIAPPPNALYTQLGVGLAGVINGHIGRVPKVRIGKYELQDVLATFPDSVAFGAKVQQNELRRDANLGGEFLRRFRVTFNYEEGYIVLKPDKKLFDDAFDHDMSGIDLVAQGDGYHRFFIQHITLGSPAYKAGLKEGDQILAINGVSTEEINMGYLKQLFQTKEGKSFKVKIRRENKILTANLTLQRMI